MSTDYSSRPDWSPIAQKPDFKTGVIAHTPDPKAYHTGAIGATILPRATANWGSRGFSTEPTTMQIDPTFEDTVEVDLRDFDKEGSRQAWKEAEGDPIETYRLVSERKKKQKQSLKTGEAAMPVPRPVASPQPAYSPASLQPISSSASLQPLSSAAAPAAAASPAAKVAETIDVEALYRQVLVATERLRQATTPEAPPPAVTPAAPSADLRISRLESLLEGLTDRIGQLLVPPALPEPVKQSPEACYATTEQIGLPFLTDPPSKPKVAVMFDMGRSGRYQKSFHYVSSWGLNLSLFYDNRYDGDRFLPPTTEEGDPPIKISFPGNPDREPLLAYFAGDYNVRMGCMDVLLFVLVKQDETPRPVLSTQPQLDEVTDFGPTPTLPTSRSHDSIYP